MSNFREPPQFRAPETVISPEVDQITKQHAFIQSGISYRTYQQIPLTDINEIYSNSRALNYYFNPKVCYINPKKTFLALKVVCTKQDDAALTTTDYVTCAPMKAHGLIDDVSVSIGKFVKSYVTNKGHK